MDKRSDKIKKNCINLRERGRMQKDFLESLKECEGVKKKDRDV